MIIQLSEVKRFWGREFVAKANSEEVARARMRPFAFANFIEIRENSQQDLTLVSAKVFAFKPTYIIKRANEEFHFCTKSFAKRHYRCKVMGDTYEIFGHVGSKYSIFRNNVQVGYWQREWTGILKPLAYTIVSNDNLPIFLSISFCLILTNSNKDRSRGNALAINVGNVGPQARKFDSSWLPNQD